MADKNLTVYVLPTGIGLGVFWFVWGQLGSFWWGVLYGLFWPVWVGFRFADWLWSR